MAKPVFTIKIEGLRELDDALGELTTATGKNVMRRVLTRMAEPMRADAQAKAPVLSGTLKASLTISSRLSRRQRKQWPKESTVELYVGAPSLPQATLQEFGSANQAPQPFLRPAFDANWQQALAKAKDMLAEEIRKAAARAARKTARLARKS